MVKPFSVIQWDCILKTPQNITRDANDKETIMTRDIWESSVLQEAHGFIDYKAK